MSKLNAMSKPNVVLCYLYHCCRYKKSFDTLSDAVVYAQQTAIVPECVTDLENRLLVYWEWNYSKGRREMMIPEEGVRLSQAEYRRFIRIIKISKEEENDGKGN